jgi:tryptophan halogenase
LRWNGPAYRDLLVREAQRVGVQHVAGAIGAAEPDGAGGIASVAVEGAGAIAADLFVDCTGPRAQLLSQLPAAERRDWSRLLPIRALLLGRPAAPVLALGDRATLVAEGWRAELAGRDGLQATLAIADGVTEAAARGALGAEPAGFVSVSPGRAAEAWLGNVVALGDAAAHFEPLGWHNLDLAHRQLALLLELLPGREPDPRERAEFNRRAGLMADRLLDVLGAHYAAPAAEARFGRLERSAELTVALDQYHRRGRLPFFEEAPLLTQEFSALLEALGHEAGTGALTRAVDPSEADAAGAAFGAKAQAALQATPPYAAWLSEVLRG